jgi:hypothetical protein
MTLADMLTTLESRGALPVSRVKDMKTSLRYLAHALGHPALDQCPVDATCREEATWAHALETHFATLETQGRTISVVTRRNSRNNLRTVFRLAGAHGLLKVPLPPRLLTTPRRAAFLLEQRKTAPYQTTYQMQTTPRRFGLPQAQWPPDIAEGWRDYRAKCGLRLRETTFDAYVKRLVTYLGYFTHICGRTPAWNDLFDEAQLTAFVQWQGGRVGRRVGHQGLHVVQVIAAMAVVLKHPNARVLADLRNSLPRPAPVHAKQAHWVSLGELEAVAEACLAEGRRPYSDYAGARCAGVRRATRFQLGVMLKLLVRVPLRQRNLRELRLETNLYKDTKTGHWHLHFSGDELKIGTRNGKINEYHVDMTDYRADFLPVLEEFLQVYRPRLLNPTGSTLLFLTRSGKPFTKQSLGTELSYIVSRHTGQRFFPHLVRTIWATEYIKKSQDFATAAVMLGDTLKVVLATYFDILPKDHHAKSSAFLDEALHG